MIVLLAGFAALGFGLEWLFWRASAGLRQRLIAAGLDSVRDRLRAVGLRTAYGLGLLLAFALGSIGAFLLFDWPPLLKEVVLAYLLVFLVVRLVLVLGRILLAPGAERFRVVPMATAARGSGSSGRPSWSAGSLFVNITLGLSALLGMSPPAVYLVGLACGTVLVGLTLFVVWRHPERDGGAPARRTQPGRQLAAVALCGGVWLLLFTGSATPFYIGVILLLLPILIRTVHLAVATCCGRRSSETADDAVPSVTAVTLERGLRAVLFIGGACLIAWVLGHRSRRADGAATPWRRGCCAARSTPSSSCWSPTSSGTWRAPDRLPLAEAASRRPAETEEARRRARLRTLLPILRNVLFVW